MPANLITLVHFAMSSAMNLANSAGVFGVGRHGAEIGQPLLDGRVEHRRVDLLVERRDDLGRRALRRADADPGARLVALHDSCRSVGTSGRNGSRSVVVTPSGRSLPALICGSAVGVTSNITCTWPAIRSVIAGVEPR